MLRALEHGVGIDEFWRLTNGELYLMQRASLNRRDAEEERLYRALWFAVAWNRGTMPNLDDVLRMVRGEPKPRRTAAELLQKVKQFVSQIGGAKPKGKGAASGS